MFHSILVANRGEVAARVARSCRRIGADTVALLSAQDEDGSHTQAFDRSVDITSDYLDVRAVVDAAVRAGCEAVHPGYGLFDADPALSFLCERRGIRFIGPGPEETVFYRDRLEMRNIAVAAGVRVLAGSERWIASKSDLRADVDMLGYPLALKPAVGVGEQAPHAVLTCEDDLAHWESNLEWEGLPRYVERHLDRPRYVEVQIVADGEGEAIVLADREVSVRKDGRRVLAESPAPAIDALHWGNAARAAIGAAAVDFALALRFRGVGSVQFAIDAGGCFYCVGFHPSLQPEHAVVEACTNIDLVETQVRLASGEALSPAVLRAEASGHAVQARVEAALDPRTGSPFPGRADDVRWPPAPAGKVRIETGIQPQSRVAANHAPLIASVTAYAPTRHEAVLMLDRIIAETRIVPLVTNLRLLRRALNHESFRAGQVDDGFLDRNAG